MSDAKTSQLKPRGNSVIDPGPADNEHKIILPKNSTAKLAEIKNEEASIAYDTDQQTIVINDGSGFAPVSGGGGGDATSLQGVPVSTTSPNDGEALVYDSGTNEWAPAASGSGANTALSNLTPTSINQGLVPNGDNTLGLGGPSASWSDMYLYNVYAPDTNRAIHVQNRTLYATGGSDIFNWSNTSGSAVLKTALNMNGANYIWNSSNVGIGDFGNPLLGKLYIQNSLADDLVPAITLRNGADPSQLGFNIMHRTSILGDMTIDRVTGGVASELMRFKRDVQSVEIPAQTTIGANASATNNETLIVQGANDTPVVQVRGTSADSGGIYFYSLGAAGTALGQIDGVYADPFAGNCPLHLQNNTQDLRLSNSSGGNTRILSGVQVGSTATLTSDSGSMVMGSGTLSASTQSFAYGEGSGTAHTATRMGVAGGYSLSGSVIEATAPGGSGGNHAFGMAASGGGGGIRAATGGANTGGCFAHGYVGGGGNTQILANGSGSFAGGHADGNNALITAGGAGAFAHGNAAANKTLSSAHASVAVGEANGFNIAAAPWSIVVGTSNEQTHSASGTFSQSFGDSNNVTGNAASSFGLGNTNASYGSMLIGRYGKLNETPGSWDEDETAFAIGNGTAVGAESLSFSITKAGHIESDQTTPPVLTPEVATGTGGTTVFENNATDMCGIIVVTAGTGSSTGQILSMDFDVGYLSAPVVQITPRNANAAALDFYANTDSGAIYLWTGAVPLVDTMEYQFNYTVIGKSN